MKKVIVVGAGASGLMAAYAAAMNGNFVTVCEKNEKAGKKIYITGKGRCNVTNNTDPEGVLANTVHNARFLKGAAYALPPERLMSLLEEGGLPLKTERGNRVFPVAEKLHFKVGDYIYIENIDRYIRDGAESIPAKHLSGGNVKDISLSVGSLTQDEKNIILKGCLINFNAAH